MDLVSLAYESGFSNASHFFRSFRKCTGTTPIRFTKDGT
ncbi:MAG: helix-turn-helix domain-containing protein [Deltaproteobacteria bacterium]|nr:MAG: helix-turn-helix domain-containing protein [Deltaproteobacteria bacterium]